MVSANGKVNINLMNFLFTNFSSVSVNGVADVDGVDHIIQHMNKVPQHQDKQQPGQCSHKV